jgi:hypothetical protein
MSPDGRAQGCSNRRTSLIDMLQEVAQRWEIRSASHMAAQGRGSADNPECGLEALFKDT